MEQENKIGTQEIDLVEIAQKIWKNRKLVLKATGIFAAFGFMVAILSPNVYTAFCTMVPQTTEKKVSGNISGLAAMAGINLGGLNTGEVLSPNVYPRIINNINFKKDLMYSKFHFEGINSPISLYEYYTDKRYSKFNLLGNIRKYTIGLPGVIIGAISSKKEDIELNPQQHDTTSVQTLSEKEERLSVIINSLISITLNNKDGYILLSSKMSEPLAAAELAQRTQELLQKYITKFKLEKVAKNLEFVENNYNEARKNFEDKQIELAQFRDANKSFSSSLAKTNEEKLLSEYTLLSGVYSELAKQKEQAKIAVTETTPILTIIEPVTVPTEKTEPKRKMILLAYSLLGLFIGIGLVFLIPYMEEHFFPNIKKYKIIPKVDN